MENNQYTKINDDTIGMVNVVPISIADLLVQKKNGEDMIDEGQRILDDANAKLQKALDLGMVIPEN